MAPASERVPRRRLHVADAVATRRPARAEAELVEHVLRRFDELRAFADQLVAALRERRMDRARDREHFAALLARPPRRDQRSRRQRRLDDQHAAGKAADQPVAPRKVFLARRRARQELRHDPAASRDAPREIAVARRIDAIGPRADDGERRGFRRERALVRGGVDAERESRHDRQAGRRQARCANSRAFALPCGVACRLPTIANAGWFRSSRRPMKNSTGGAWPMSSRARG